MNLGPKKCFFISPIGEDDSPERDRANDVLDLIVTPALRRCNYQLPPIRADQLPNPGRITRQIVEHLLNADLVVADLTDHNPNVFYELAVRHASKKPVVQIIHRKSKLPFDVANQRTIFYNHEKPREVYKAIDEIALQIESMETDPENVDNPLTEALFFESLKRSGDPVARSNADIMKALQDFKDQLDEIRGAIGSLAVGREPFGSSPPNKGKKPIDAPSLARLESSFRMVNVMGRQTSLEPTDADSEQSTGARHPKK
jgi:hypothetical protein